MPEQGAGVYQFCDTGIYDVQFSKIVDLVVLAIELLAVIIFVGLWHRNYRRMVSNQFTIRFTVLFAVIS